MPSLEQIAAQYSLNRFPRHPYDRAKYEQGFKDGVNSVLENEDVNDLVIDACRNEISRLKTQISLHVNDIVLVLTKKELELLDYITHRECHDYLDPGTESPEAVSLRSKVIDLVSKIKEQSNEQSS